MKITRRSARSGSTLIELTLVVPFLTFLFLGTWQFGYAFYLYDQVEQAVRAGTRYASAATYDEANPTLFTQRVQRMVVYGDANAADTAEPVVRGLELRHITVDPHLDAKGVPRSITVAVSGYSVGTLGLIPLNGKPSLEIPYVGNFRQSSSK